MADAVVQTDAIEGHVGGLAAEPAGEDLAIVGEDLLRDAIGVEGFQQRIVVGPSPGIESAITTVAAW